MQITDTPSPPLPLPKRGVRPRAGQLRAVGTRPGGCTPSASQPMEASRRETETACVAMQHPRCRARAARTESLCVLLSEPLLLGVKCHAERAALALALACTSSSKGSALVPATVCPLRLFLPLHRICKIVDQAVNWSCCRCTGVRPCTVYHPPCSIDCGRSPASFAQLLHWILFGPC